MPVTTRLLRLIPVAILSTVLAACNGVGYYIQSVNGQLDMWARERPVTEVIADPETDEKLRRKLVSAEKIRDFASRELKLPDNPSYRTYADLGRPFAVWNVFAASEFSVIPVQWCFPVAGCVSYRGYFDSAAAERFAAGITAEGREVYVGGVPAYSTLGYFSDPLLNTFINFPDTELASLMFHELAHQVAYASDDTSFNESFAVTVEVEGVKRWLAMTGNVAARDGFERRQRARAAFQEIVERCRNRLDELYQSDLKPEAMRERKAEIFALMKDEYRAFRKSDGSFSGYDRWFEQRPNNAQIASVAIYTQLVPSFRALLASEGGDLDRFYARVKQLADMPKAQRNEALRKGLSATSARR